MKELPSHHYLFSLKIPFRGNSKLPEIRQTYIYNVHVTQLKRPSLLGCTNSYKFMKMEENYDKWLIGKQCKRISQVFNDALTTGINSSSVRNIHLPRIDHI